MPIVLQGAAAAFYEATDEEILLEGRAGTGKSVSACKFILDTMAAYPGSQNLLCRETRRSMTDTILVTLESIIGESHPEVTRCKREQRHSYRLFGSELVCAGLDEPTKAFGAGWDKIYLNEAIESSLDAWELFGRSARDPKLKRGAGRVRPRHQRIADCNPTFPGHWLNHRASTASDRLRMVETYDDWLRLDEYNRGPQDKAMRRIIFCHQDNPAHFDVERWEWTEDGSRNLKSLQSMSGSRLKRMFYGLWAASEGAVYVEFDEQKHVIDPFPIPREWPCIIAKDPGRDHPDATILATVAPTGQIFLVAESVVRQTTTAQDAEALNRLCAPFNVVKKLGDPHYMFSNTKMSDSGRTIAQQMRDFGHVFQPAPAARNQTEISQQVEMVRTLLVTLASDGSPMLQVFRTCPKTINGFQSWGYVRNTRGEMPGGEDRFEDIGDDEMDCVRMIIASKPTYESHTFRMTRHE